LKLRATGAVVAALLTSSCVAATLELELAAKAVLKARLEAGKVGRWERQASLRNLFADVGCATSTQPLGKRTGNIVCSLPGETAETIVVGGHLDFAELGEGIVDDWSGVSLLPSLYQVLKVKPRHYTFVFVAFDEEESGLVGSSKYVKQLNKEQKSAIRAFVNLECLGLGPTNVWAHRSSPALLNSMTAVANAIHVELRGVNVEKVGDDDTHPFFAAHVPVISLHSVTQDTLPILHSTRDKVDAVQLDAYFESYKLVALYLAYLDSQAPGQ
jgi:aminopeptidase-like protein